MCRAPQIVGMINFEKIERSISCLGWFYFGRKKSKCSSFTEKNLKFYERTERLPPPCDKCYKALIFWEGSYSKENLKNFFSMFDLSEVDGKLNERVVVFYFWNKTEMLDFLKQLEKEMKEHGVNGKLQWRRACREYQDCRPELWKNAKEFIPDA